MSSYLPLFASSSTSTLASSSSASVVEFVRSRLSTKRTRRVLAVVTVLLLVLGLVVHRTVVTIKAISPYHRANLMHTRLPTWLADLTFPIAPPWYFTDDYHEIKNLANPPLASYSCPPLHNATRGEGIVNPLLMLATFSVANNFATRDMLRSRRRVGLLPKDDALLETVFVLGALPPPGDAEGEKKEREGVEKKLEVEQERYGDLFRLGMEENMDEGKTYEFFKQVVRRAESTGPSPQFVIKVDEDTVLSLPPLLTHLSTLSCSQGIYWGTSIGSCISACFPPYFQGMAYGLSHPLLAHLAHSNLEHGHSRGTEDARAGSWMGAVDERTRLGEIAGEEGGKRVQWEEVGTLLGGEDWWYEQRETRWIGKHAFKERENWLERWSRLLTAWAEKGKPFVWLGGDEVAKRP